MPNFKLLYLAALCLPALAKAEQHPSSLGEYGWFEPAAKPVERAWTPPEHFAAIQASGNDTPPKYPRGEEAELLDAVDKNQTEQVRTLLKNGISPNVRDFWRDSALLRAVRQDNFEMAVLLLEHGAQVNRKGRGYTPLGMAAQNGNLPIVKLLLKAGADADEKSDGGNTPLHLAALMNRMDVAMALLNAQADLTLLNRSKMTPLAVAAAVGHGEIVSVLMTWGGCSHADECRERY